MINLPLPTINTHSSNLPEGLSDVTQRYNRGIHHQMLFVNIIMLKGSLMIQTTGITSRFTVDPRKSLYLSKLKGLCAKGLHNTHIFRISSVSGKVVLLQQMDWSAVIRRH